MTRSDPSRVGEPTTDGHRRGQSSGHVRDAQRGDAWRDLDQSSIMSVELIAAIATWGAIGWMVDRWVNTAPWLFGTGVLIGFAAGLYLIWLRTQRSEEPVVANSAGPSTDTDTEG